LIPLVETIWVGAVEVGGVEVGAGRVELIKSIEVEGVEVGYGAGEVELVESVEVTSGGEFEVSEVVGSGEYIGFEGADCTLLL
jgi:hypothetical protein